jgi:PAS domain S-box-containing protein
MQTAPMGGGDDFVAAFAQQRQVLLHRASSIISSPQVAQSDSHQNLSQMLLSALEVLKVAEEELRDERRERETERTKLLRQAAHARALFYAAPTALFLTTSDTTVREVNEAGAKLLRRPIEELAGQQLWMLVARSTRDTFREELEHVIKLGSVAAWSFTFERRSDVPVVVKASVRVDIDPGTEARALYWHIQPLEPSHG